MYSVQGTVTVVNKSTLGGGSKVSLEVLTSPHESAFDTHCLAKIAGTRGYNCSNAKKDSTLAHRLARMESVCVRHHKYLFLDNHRQFLESRRIGTHASDYPIRCVCDLALDAK